MSNWSRRINQRQGDLFALDDLFVPINMNNAHWLFIHIDIKNKKIELYHSFGGNSNSREYLTKMRKYLYDEAFKDMALDLRPDFEVWKRDWKTQDKNSSAPKQGNGDNCGVFIILSIYLLSCSK